MPKKNQHSAPPSAHPWRLPFDPQAAEAKTPNYKRKFKEVFDAQGLHESALNKSANESDARVFISSLSRTIETRGYLSRLA